MTSRRSPSTFLVLLVFVAFISLGLPDAVQGVAWPAIRVDFGYSLGEPSYILIPGALGYFTSGAIGGVMMQKLGVGRVLAISTGLVTGGLVTYALTPNLWFMIPAAFVIGIMLIAFSNASVFPMLMSLTPERLGRNAAIHAIGWQVGAATFGGAFIPSMAGFLAQSMHLIVITQIMVVMAVMLILLEGVFRIRAEHPDHRATLG